MKIIHTLILILLTTNFLNAQNIKIIHSDFKSIVPGQKDGTLKNTYNYMVKSDKPISIDTININDSKIWFPQNPITFKDSINIRIKLITEHYFSANNKETKFVKVSVNGQEIPAQISNRKIPKDKQTVTSFLMSTQDKKFNLDITKFDTEIFIPMP